MYNLTDVRRFRRAVDPAPELAQFDFQSGLAQRTLFQERLERQWDLCADRKLPLTVLLIGIDGLGRDDDPAEQPLTVCIGGVGRVIAGVCRRRADFAGRMRRAEVGVMLVESFEDGAAGVAEKIVRQVQAQALPHPLDSESRVTVSLGAVVTVPTHTRFASSLLIRADDALKAAREAGGNGYSLRDHG